MKYNFIKFFIIFFLIIFINPNISISGTSEDKIFKVKNISVSAESTSSAKAKEIAILEAINSCSNTHMTNPQILH